MRQVPSTPRHHVRGCPAGPRSGVGVLRSRLRQPYRWCQPRSPIARREEGGIRGLRIGRRWRQGRNPAGQDESRDQDSDHGWSIPWRPGLRCAARRAASALPATCASRRRLPPAFYSEVAEGVGFEPTRERNPLLVFKTSALNHSAILPNQIISYTYSRYLMRTNPQQLSHWANVWANPAQTSRLRSSVEVSLPIECQSPLQH